MKKDSCPNCLDQMKVVIGDFQAITQLSATHSLYKFMCPDCKHIWTCLFLTSRSEIGTVGGIRWIKSDGTIGHLKDGETIEINELDMLDKRGGS